MTKLEWEKVKKILIEHTADHFGDDCFELNNCVAAKKLKKLLKVKKN